MNQQLVDYINQSRQRGATDNQIRQTLLDSGWQENDINQSLDSDISPSMPLEETYKRRPKKKIIIFVIIGVIVITGVIALGRFLLIEKNLQDTLEYKYYDPNIPFSFRYPKDYCWTQDIAAVVIHRPPFCGGNNSVNVTGSSLIVFAFPEFEVNTTEEYINTERLRNLQKTGKKRNIGGYSAIELKNPQQPSGKIYAFLTDFEFKFPENTNAPDSLQQLHPKYGIIISSNLSDESGGEKGEELILSTFTFQ